MSIFSFLKCISFEYYELTLLFNAMRKEYFRYKALLCVSIFILTIACSRKSLSLSTGDIRVNSGDIIDIKVNNPQNSQSLKAMIGKERVLIVSSSDSTISIMAPANIGSTSKLKVNVENNTVSVPVQITQSTTTRLWFSFKNDTIKFVQKQVSHEEFVQNKCNSINKMLYEITNSNGENLVLGYINNPISVETVSKDKKGLSNFELKKEVLFSVNVPAFSDMNTIRFSAINASNNYVPKIISETPIKK